MTTAFTMSLQSHGWLPVRVHRMIRPTFARLHFIVYVGTCSKATCINVRVAAQLKKCGSAPHRGSGTHEPVVQSHSLVGPSTRRQRQGKGHPAMRRLRLIVQNLDHGTSVCSISGQGAAGLQAADAFLVHQHGHLVMARNTQKRETATSVVRIRTRPGAWLGVYLRDSKELTDYDF